MALTRINNQALTNVTSDALPTGTVLQVKQATMSGSGSATTTATSFTDVGLSVTITPKFANSKFYVSVHHIIAIDNGSENTRVDYRCIGTHNSTDTQVYRMEYFGHDGTTPSRVQKNMSGSGLFEATTNTNDITFKCQLQKAASAGTESGTIRYKWYTGSKATITVMEIAG